MPYDYIEEYQKQNDETIWLFHDKDAQEKIDTSSTETDYANPLTLETMQAQLAENTKIKIEPIQDLHGYDKPWVGGAGKNKYNINVKTYPYEISSITVSNDGGVLNLNGTVSGNEFLFPDSVGLSYPNQLFYKDIIPSTSYVFSVGYSGNSIKLQVFYRETESSSWILLTENANQDSISFTTPASYAVLWIRARFPGGQQLNNVKIYPMIRLSTESDATFAPYTNICPISGHDEIKIDGCGKNLFDWTNQLSFAGFIDISAQMFNQNSNYKLSYIKCKPNTTYTISKEAGKTFRIATSVQVPAKDIPYIGSSANHTGTSIIYTTESNAIYLSVLYWSSNNGDTKTADELAQTIQIEESSSATDYSPYQQSNNLSIDLPSTVYGGVLDLESGELVVDKVTIDLGNLPWSMTTVTDTSTSGQYRLQADLSNLKPAESVSIKGNMICSAYENVPATATWNKIVGISTTTSARIYIYDINYNTSSSASAFTTFITGQILCYELATPTTIQLTPSQLYLLKNQNNLTTSQYTQIKVTYRNGVFATLEELSDTANGIYEEISGDATTVSGNPINFTTREKQKSKSTIIDLNPIQDLHGYSKPWVGGTGKNLLPLDVATIKSLNTDGTWSGNKYTLSNVEFTILVDSDNNVIGIKMNTLSTLASNVDLKLFGDFSTTTTYTSAGSYTISLGGDGPNLYAGYQSATLLQTNGTPTATCSNGLSWSVLRAPLNKSLSNVTIYPMIRLSSVTDSTFEPYTNIASISGRSSVDIDGCGKNCKPDVNWYRNNSGNFSYIGDDSTTRIRTESFKISSGQYILSGIPSGSSLLAVRCYDKDENRLSDATISNNTFTLDNNVRYIHLLCGGTNYTSSTNAEFKNTEMQLELGSSATIYEPYTPSTDLTISFGTTVYGGRLDVEKGELVVDRGYAEYDGSSDENWGLDVDGRRVYIARTDSDVTDSMAAISNRFASVTDTQTYSKVPGISLGIKNGGKVIQIANGQTMVLENWKTWLTNNNVQVTYPLSTPQTLQLTPQQVQLLKGINNISTTGTTITVIFKNGSVAHLNDLPENVFTDLDKEKLASIDTLAVTLDLLTHTLIVTQDV